MNPTARSAWGRFLSLCRPLFSVEVRPRAVGGIILLLSILLLLSGLIVVNSYIGRDFMTAIADREPARYFQMAGLYLIVFAVSALLNCLAQFVQDRLALLWRNVLSIDLLNRYFRDHIYLRLKGRTDIDNPDQRITEDVRTLTADTVSFTVMVVNATITILAFAGVLWSITPWLLFGAILYPAVGSLMTIMVGRRLVGLNNHQLRKEADLRYALIHAREYADPLAQRGGEEHEKSRIRLRLQTAIDNFRTIIAVSRNLLFFTGGYGYLVQVIPILIVAPRYLHGEVEFGVVTQASMAFAQVNGGFSLFVLQFQSISSFAAVVTRLGALEEALEAESLPAKPALRVLEDEPRLAYDNVTLKTPRDGRLLIRDLTLEVPRGLRVLITGPNGAGKSALMRAVAGTWIEGSGTIHRPNRQHVHFLPQHPEAMLGTLREQLTDGTGLNGDSEEYLLAALRAVKFEPVLQRIGSLDVEQNWADILSTGEQQELALARLLLAAPDYAFLDDALSALDSDRQTQLYEVLSQTDITYVSIAGQTCLRAFHDMILELHCDGTWTVLPAARSMLREPMRLAGSGS